MLAQNFTIAYITDDFGILYGNLPKMTMGCFGVFYVSIVLFQF